MIDASKTRYDLVVITPDGRRLHILELTSGLMWEEQPDELATRLQFTIKNQLYKGDYVHKLIPLMGHAVIYADWGFGWNEMHRGRNFGWHYSDDPAGKLSISNYDMLYQLTRSEDNRWYKNGTTGRVIIEDLAKSFGIPIGTIDGPDVPLAKQVFKTKKVADMIEDVLDQSKKRGAGKYIVQADQGVMHIRRAGYNTTVYHFGYQDAAGHIDDSQGLEEIVTRVKIIGAEDDEGRAPVVATVDGNTDIGIFQRILNREEFDTPAAAKKAAEETIAESGKPKKSRKLDAPDLPFLRRGHKVHIEVGTLIGYFLVVGVQHDPDSRRMLMEVEDYEG